MKIVCAPDSFKESIDAVAAARAMAEGIRRALPDADIDCCPVGDGGEGTLASLLAALGGQVVETRVHGVLAEPCTAAFGVFDRGEFAYVESAAAIGLAALRREQRDVLAASSVGVGELLLAAAARHPRRIIIGVGGSATNDGGCGMAQALGFRFIDASGTPIARPIGGGMLREITAIDPSRRRYLHVPVSVACDVRNPLAGPEGAATVFAPQKGASAAQVTLLDDGLCHLAELVRRDLGIDVENIAGAGAAGGLGAGLVAFADAELVSGIDTVLKLVRFESRVRDADLCLTGEGRLDAQSLSGKTCLGVARAAARANVPVVALVGAAGPGADKCLDAGLDRYVVIGQGLPAERSIREAATLLADAAAALARNYADNNARMRDSTRN